MCTLFHDARECICKPLHHRTFIVTPKATNKYKVQGKGEWHVLNLALRMISCVLRMLFSLQFQMYWLTGAACVCVCVRWAHFPNSTATERYLCYVSTLRHTARWSHSTCVQTNFEWKSMRESNQMRLKVDMTGCNKQNRPKKKKKPQPEYETQPYWQRSETTFMAEEKPKNHEQQKLPKQNSMEK